ncbi:MAG TPA: alpha-E domain-containing protein [Flavipsychrobacter sp.]|nr:alpha-E domain-containing protein [Flavipsychrobacter sp.]
MLSRVAESVFWMSRYMERTNGVLRILRTNYVSSQNEVKDFSWQTLLRSYSDAPQKQLLSLANESRKALHHLLLDRENDSSVINNITRARENARAVQDHTTKEVWQCLNDYYHLIRQPAIEQQILHGDPLTAMDRLISDGMLYHGIVDVTMAREEPFYYVNIGKYIERAILSVDMLQIKLTEIGYNLKEMEDVPALRYLLYSLSGYEFYLKKHRGNFQAELVLKQILFDAVFPHSVAFCLKRLLRYFDQLTPASLPESFKQLEFLIGKANNTVNYTTLDITNNEQLRNYLFQVRSELIDITTGLNKYYFANS